MARLVPVILIVEDEFLLRLDSTETIEHAGFEVIQAANADEPSQSSARVWIFMLSSPIFRCRVRWTG